MAENNFCSICKEALHANNDDNIMTVKQRGIKTLIEQSKKKGDNNWVEWEKSGEHKFHAKCRKRYAVSNNPFVTNKRIRASTPSVDKDSSIAIPSTSSKGYDIDVAFDFKEKCLLCQKDWRRHSKPGRIISKNNMKDQLLEICENRCDDWGNLVHNIILSVPSLIQVEARYHTSCYRQFQQKPVNRPVGRPVDEALASAFKNLCEYMESKPDSIFQLSELRNVMSDYVPCNETLYTMLERKYKKSILILQSQGVQPIICFLDFAMRKLREASNQAEDEPKTIQQEKILKSAANIISKDIQAVNYDTTSYESPLNFFKNIESEIPHSLNYFMHNLLLSASTAPAEKRDIKRVSIAHTILATCHPATYQSSLQVAIGTYIYRKTASKTLINILSKLGLCCSYYNVQLFEASCIMHSTFKFDDETFVQFVFDNADHNVATLDGQNTWHCMGGICCVTPGNFIESETKIPKLAKMPTAAELALKNAVDIIPYETFQQTSGLQTVIYKDVATLRLGETCRLSPAYGTYLWSKFLIDTTPNWKGFMENLTYDSRYTVSRVVCLPFINLPPSNLTTINSALHLAVNQCKEMGQKTCFVTFDQPLYIKAKSIVHSIQNTGVNVFIRLGGFHMLMSYMGAVGNIMAGSGIEELWSLIYAPASIKQMMSGHAYARAVRAHILTYTALGMIVVEKIEDANFQLYRAQLQNLFNVSESERALNLDACNKNEKTRELTAKFLAKLDDLKDNGPTAQLWWQYFECITIMLQFIEAERLGNWQLHLKSVERMLPIFHAGGHFPYAKSAQIYLQDMVGLDLSMDDSEYENFTSQGYFTICRSDKNWSGIWTDQTIEQTLMRDTKEVGGLTHGRGVTPSIQTRFISAKLGAFEIIESVEEYCQIYYGSSEQHADLRPTRRLKDNEDIKKLCNWFSQHNPFAIRSNLQSLSTGIVGDAKIDSHLAFSKGRRSMDCMFGKDAKSLVLKASSKVNSLSIAKSGVKLDDNYVISVNSTLLFQRISVLVHNDKNEAQSALQYELSPYPLALFDSTGVMKKSKNPSFTLCSHHLVFP